MSAARLYLDHNATTPLRPEVLAAMAEVGPLANPSSQHASGRRAKQILEDCREAIADLLGARLHGPAADRLVITSGGTEANNLALASLARPDRFGVVSAIEHPSVAAMADSLIRHGHQIELAAVTSDGLVDLDLLAARIDRQPAFVSLMLANNETGVLQPLADVARLCRSAGVPLHTDAVQAVGKVPVSFRDLDVAAMTVAAHKFAGPRGIGALFVRSGVELAPRLFGGHQQEGIRPGTEPVELVVGMRKALELALDGLAQRSQAIAQLRDEFEQLLLAEFPSAVVNGGSAPRLPNTSNVSFPGLDRQAAMLALDLAGIECSTGSACASGSSEPSPALVAMGLPKALYESALRFSFGLCADHSLVVEASRRIAEALNGLRHRKSSRNLAETPRLATRISL